MSPSGPKPGPLPIGWLPDGTPYYVAPGSTEGDETGVRCHLCGRWFRSVPAHLRVHGIDRRAYVELFDLELNCPLEGALTRKRRSVALSTRIGSEPAIRAAVQAAVTRARSGELAQGASEANRGRPHSLQRRGKAIAALATVSRENQLRANRGRAREQLLRVGHEAVTRRGFPDLETYVLQGLASGRSLAALSVAVGLHKDWLSRHIDKVLDDTSWRRQLAGPRDDPRWTSFLAREGFSDLAAFLRQRHLVDHQSLAAIALESGLGRAAVQTAFERHAVPRRSYANSRHLLDRRQDEALARVRGLGFGSLEAYLQARRAAECPWDQMAREAGLPASWLRRRWAAMGRTAASRSTAAASGG